MVSSVIVLDNGNKEHEIQDQDVSSWPASLTSYHKRHMMGTQGK